MAVCFIGGGVPVEKQQPTTSHWQTISHTFTFRVHLGTEWNQNDNVRGEQAMITHVIPPASS